MPSSAAEALARSGSEDSAPATSCQRSSMRLAMRWTAPMKAPWPPPTIPSFNRVIGPSILLIWAGSRSPPAKSSNAVFGVSIRCAAMKGAPSAAPCSADFRQHSHSSTAQLS